MNMIHCTHDDSTEYHFPITQRAAFLLSWYWLQNAFRVEYGCSQYNVKDTCWFLWRRYEDRMNGLDTRGELCDEGRELFDKDHQGRSQEGIHVGAVSTVRMVVNAPYSFVPWSFEKGSSISARWVVHSRGEKAKVVAVFSVKCGGR